MVLDGKCGERIHAYTFFVLMAILRRLSIKRPVIFIHRGKHSALADLQFAKEVSSASQDSPLAANEH